MAWDKFKRIFVAPEEVPEDKKEVKKQPEKTTIPENKTISSNKQTYSQPINTSTTTNTSTDTQKTESGTSGQFNDRVFEQLTKAIADANLPGEDYLEFVQALKAMENLPLDESVKIQTVLATLSTRGLTVQKVFESADYYLKVLQNEHEKFDIALSQKTDHDLKAKQKELQDLEILNEEKLKQIELLKQEIEKNKEELLRMKNELHERNQKIKETADSFEFTYNVVADQIKQTITKIKAITGL